MCEEESPQRLSFNKQWMLCLPLRHEELAAVLLVLLLPLCPGDAFGNRPRLLPLPLLCTPCPLHTEEIENWCRKGSQVPRLGEKLRWASDVVQPGVNGILGESAPLEMTCYELSLLWLSLWHIFLHFLVNLAELNVWNHPGRRYGQIDIFLYTKSPLVKGDPQGLNKPGFAICL